MTKYQLIDSPAFLNYGELKYSNLECCIISLIKILNGIKNGQIPTFIIELAINV